MSELRISRYRFWALPVQRRAQQALAARLRSLIGDVLDGDCRAESLDQVVVSG